MPCLLALVAREGFLDLPVFFSLRNSERDGGLSSAEKPLSTSAHRTPGSPGLSASSEERVVNSCSRANARCPKSKNHGSRPKGQFVEGRLHWESGDRSAGLQRRHICMAGDGRSDANRRCSMNSLAQPNSLSPTQEILVVAQNFKTSEETVCAKRNAQKRRA